MSANGDGDDGEEIPGREVAYRLFAAEYDDASLSYAESDEERAPNYVVSPTGARLNRVFAVGTLTEVTSVNDEMVRARIVDPTGAFVVYAGQYQPDELATLEQLEPPEFVAVTGKARTFQPDDSDQVYTSLRPESIATVDADTRDRWVVSAAEQTVERVGTYAAAAESGSSGDALTEALLEAGVDKGLAAGIPLAQDHYGTTPGYLAALRDTALEAVEVVAGDRDQVEALSLAPGDAGPDADATFASLAGLAGIDLSALESASAADAEAEPEPEPEPAAATAGTGSAAGTATGTDRDTASEGDVDVAAEAGETEIESTSESAEADATGDVAESEPESDEPTAEFDESSVDESDADADLETAEESADEELGDFDAGDGGMYEMDEEEREQLEEEFGAEFTTGSEVDEPGEADIDVPEPEDEPADESETESEAAADAAATDESAEPEESDEVDDDLGAPPESGLEAESEPETEADETELKTESEPEAEPDEDETAAEPADSEDEAAAATASEPDETESDDAPAADVDLEAYVVETMEELDDGDGADRTTLVERVADDTGASADEVEDAIQDALMGGQCYEPDDETLKAI
ncbi:RPA family protein [Haloterrigena alkaliphila]|uniref:RPA family protein n=1 Tax=Haloterrigena alkaliphila TaxID=2816475 RepID=UPI001CFF607F|nr:hypothetical protein [Haloterrigena alkaliphila]UHQ95427.1 hypothetical protein J0X25_20645 [Haloterrigena alkaliphila]